MKPLSIRAGLTAWFVGLTTLLLAAFSTVLYFTARDALHAGLDERLRTEALGLVALCDWDEELGAAEFEIGEEIAERLAESRPRSSGEIWTWPDRRILHRYGVALTAALPPAGWPADFTASAPPRVEFATKEAGPDVLRVCTVLAVVPAVAAANGDPPKPAFMVLVRTAEPFALIETQLASLAWWIAGLTAVSAVVVYAFGVLLSRRVVKPLRALGAAAREIRAGRDVRLPHRGVGDEVDDLGDHLEHAFQRLEDALRRQTRFTSDAAHELRNPISVIRSAAEVGLRRERSPEEYRSLLADVLATAMRMGRVTEALLLLARLDAGKVGARFHEVDLRALARDSAGAAPQAAARVRVADGDPTMVRGDEELLRVLIDNLISNALRYSPEELPVEVRVLEGDRIRLEVADRGPGIPHEHLERVFERFYRATDAAAHASGTGLGLAIVAEVARLHGAEPHVASSPAGTVVSVEFPRPPA